MNFRSDIKPISFIKTNAAEMLKQVNTTHNPIVITQNGEARAVLLDTESYQSMRSALGLLKILAQSENEIERNKLHEHESVFSELEHSLKA
jgi:prevent-host-death family protein